jgi:hypothetical protein
MENCLLDSDTITNNDEYNSNRDITKNYIEGNISLKNNIINTPNSNNIDPSDLSKLSKSIECLEKIHHIEIAKIFKTNNVYLNENNNGIFINLNKISKGVYTEIYNYVEFVKKQELDINKDEKLKRNLETIYFKDNKDNS